METTHEEQMVRIVSSFYAACAAPTKRFRRTLCAACLVIAIVLIGVGLTVIDPLERPALVLSLCALSFALLGLSIRLALNDVRDVREHYRQSRRDLFVATFSDKEFRRKVREKRARLRDENDDAGDS
jgi:hypothetical protein